jgi:hypothetical protein
MKKELGSGSISLRYGSGDPDRDPDQNFTNPQHWSQVGTHPGPYQSVTDPEH